MSLKKPKQGYKLVANFFKHSLEIPENWDYPKFDEVVKTNPLTKIDGDTVPYIPMAAVDVSKPHFNYFDERLLSENSSLTKFQENDVLFARITPSTENGKTCIVENFPKKGIVSSELTVLRPTKSVFPKYLYYYVKSERIRQFAISQMSGSTGRQRVPDYVFKKDLNFELPSIHEQQKIASILSNVDELISSYDAATETTIKLKNGLMQQLLAKGIKHKKFKKIKWRFGTEIEIPENWHVDKFLHGIKFLTDYEANGSFEKLRDNVKVDQGKPFAWYVRGTDLEHNRHGLVSGNRYCDKKTYDWLKKTRLHGGELLITKRGEIGKIYFMPNVKVPTTLAPNLYLILLNDELIPKLAFYWFKNELGNKEITRIDDSAVQGAIYKEPIKNCFVLFPPIPEQQKIVDILTNIDSNISDLYSKKNRLKNLKKGLIQNLLTGKIRVKV